jgi:hypothetical protein
LDGIFENLIPIGDFAMAAEYENVATATGQEPFL